MPPSCPILSGCARRSGHPLAPICGDLLSFTGAAQACSSTNGLIEQAPMEIEMPVSSAVHAQPAPMRYRALQRYLAWSPALLGIVLALVGLILAGGGAYLAVLGGSLYYVTVGVMLLVAAYLLIKRKIAGVYTYFGVFAFTSV